MKLINNSRNLLAPAKINIRLEVLDKRQDGYHEIRSIMCHVGLYDVVTLSPSNKGINLTSNSIHIPVGTNNLAYKSASLLMRKAKISGGVNIHLEKHIPIAAGLGGGSSDAAAVMKGVNDLYELKYSPSELMKLGSEIGADVPFFFFQSPARATGIGEKLSPLNLSPPFWTLLVTPPIPVSTAWAYGQFGLEPGDGFINIPEKIDLLLAGKQILYNALEDIVIRRFPEIDEIKKVLIKLGAWGSRMSGSGPTVFGIFFKEKEIKRAEAQLLRNYSNRGWTISVAKALS
ncbi:MAG: 4-(cytidine 5'-diphospho)-2-C-methyl-D-erythritol kinase [Deltaproteobacteria bacterium]|nr:4-(cytidine 5'-diphospho)-2-C-methyl-D-erythritol kinase [Deltaproteobacteria bacterium]